MKKKEKTAWKKVIIARNINRPKSQDYYIKIQIKQLKQQKK